MWAYTIATLRQALRSPVTWVLAALTVFSGWFATSAAILAISDLADQSEALVLSTAHLGGVLLTLWLVARSLDEDRTSGFACAADASAAGCGGRILGRWAGGTLAGATLSAATGALIASTSALQQPPALLLLYTNVLACGIVAAWAMLIGTWWRSGGATLAVFLAWVLGHLPWGVPQFLEGPGGRALAALLPGPRHGLTGLNAMGYTSAAIAGLLLLALAFSKPVDA